MTAKKKQRKKNKRPRFNGLGAKVKGAMFPDNWAHISKQLGGDFREQGFPIGVYVPKPTEKRNPEHLNLNP